MGADEAGYGVRAIWTASTDSVNDSVTTARPLSSESLVPTMPLSLAEAAQVTGLNRSTILRAIKRGAISGVRGERGAWSVEPIELHRVFPPATAGAKAMPQHTYVDALIAELRVQIADMRQERDAWRGVAERLARRVLAGWNDMPPELREAIERALAS
jgi:hypothetical protein